MTDWSKVGKKSRRKGGEYERKICHFLTDITGVKFKRSPRSGALLREGRISGIYISGDLTSDRDFVFSIECKNRDNISIESALKNPQTAELTKSWHQCVYDAFIASKMPLLFFYVRSVRSDFMVVDNNGLSLLFPDLSNQPVIHIRGLDEPVTHVIDNKEVTLKLPPMNILCSKALDGVDFNNNETFAQEGGVIKWQDAADVEVEETEKKAK